MWCGWAAFLLWFWGQYGYLGCEVVYTVIERMNVWVVSCCVFMVYVVFRGGGVEFIKVYLYFVWLVGYRLLEVYISGVNNLCL